MISIDPIPDVDKIKILLLDYEIPEHLLGFEMLAEAVALKIYNPYFPFKTIYSHIASSHGMTVDAVSRDLNYAVKKSDKLELLLSTKSKYIFAERVISFIAIHIKPILFRSP